MYITIIDKSDHYKTVELDNQELSSIPITR